MRGNGTVTSYAYDPASRLTSLVQDFAGTTHDVSSSFTYTAASQIASRTRSNDLYAWNGAVALNRPYTNNGLNQHMTSGGAALGYDGNANLTSAGGTTYGYSAENRLVSYSDPAVGSRLMLYDPLGRLGLLHDGGFTYFQYDGDVAVREISMTALLRRHVHGPGSDEPLLTYEGAGLTDKRYLHADERGSIVAISNASGQVTQINAYDDYGIPQGKNAAGAVYTGGTTTVNFGRFGYTGQAWLPEVGLSYYKARMYSPTMGRFMQTDPIGYGDGVNLYAYVGGDPINFSDPSGLAAEKPAPKAVIPIAPAGDEIVVTAYKAPPPPPRGLGFLLSANRPGDRGGPSLGERNDGGDNATPGEAMPEMPKPEAKPKPPEKPKPKPKPARPTGLCGLSMTASGVGSILGHIATVSGGVALIPNPLSPELLGLAAFTGTVGGVFSLGGAVGEYFACN